MIKKALAVTIALMLSTGVAYAAPSGQTVEMAIGSGDIDTVQALLDSGLDPIGASGGISYFDDAVASGNKDMVALFLKHGANINRMMNGTTPIWSALFGGDVEMVKFLLDNGADPTIKMSGLISMKDFAKQLGNKELVSVLNEAEQKGKTAEAEETKKVPLKSPRTDLHTSLSILSDKDILEIKSTAKNLIEEKTFEKRVGYYLGTKNYAWLTVNHAPQRVQLITPYSLMRYAYFVTERSFMEPRQYTIDAIKAHNDVVWVWIWSNADSDFIIGNYNAAPGITNVVIKTKDGKIIQPLDGSTNTPTDILNAAGVTYGSLWAFPIELFSQENMPFEIILVDSEMNRKPLEVTADMLKKLK